MASTIDKIKNDIIEAINVSQKKTSAYDTEAEIVRVDGNTAWVHIAGGVTETPVKLTINAQKGDKVQVRVSNEGAWLMGNSTAPPTDDTKANEVDKKAAEAKYLAVDAVDAALKADSAAQDAVASAEIARGAAQDAQTAASNAQTAAGSAVTAASNALTAAQNAQVSADAALVSLSNVEDVVGVLDWITAHGTMTANGSTALDPSNVYFVRDNNGDYHVGSYYYSIVAEPKAEDRTSYYTLSIDESVQNYVATHVVVDTEGLWLIPDSGGNKVLIATGAGSSYTTAGTYIIGKVNGVDTVFAKFTTGGATMKATNSTQIAHLGYGEGNSESGTATAPYYALGEFRTNYIDNYSSSSTYAKGDLCSYGGNTYVCKTAITTPEAWNANHWSKSIGNYSTIEGTQLIASGDSSHAEGRYTEAAGHYSHAEGGPIGSPAPGPRAIGMCSHAEGGSFVFARGTCAHAEGLNTEANGSNAHAQNEGTIANGENQTALGRYNVADTTSAVIIGNGTGSTRSNALTIDWNGNVNIASGAKYKINGTNLSASDVSALPISGGTMTSNGQIINGHITNSSSRETTPNLTPTGKRGITALLASGTMTTARPGEGTIIHCEWDTNAGWNSQLFIADNDTGNGKPFVAVRGQKSGTWTSWDRLLAQSDVADYVIAQSQSTTSYGNGYWRWREWNSGKVEIWYHGSLSLTTSESDSNGVKRYSRWFNFPNSYSLYRCTCIVNGMDQGGWYGCGGVRGSSGTVNAEPTRAFQVMGYRIQAQPPTTPSNLNIYICGQKTT